MNNPNTPGGAANRQELETVYGQLAQSAARLLVVHEASQILRSTHDAEELSRKLLDVVAEAVFSKTGCVASLAGDELKILATRGLADHEADALAEDTGEAEVWFTVADGEEPLTREQLQVELELGDPEVESELSSDADEPEADESEGENEEEEDGGEAEEETPSGAPHFEIYLPLRVEDEVLGVLALGARVDQQPLGPDEVQLATSLSSHLALALNHAALFDERNRRIEQLGVLLQISREITSTLDLERVLTTISQMINLLLQNRRTLVALDNGGKVAVRAGSDPEFKAKDWSKDPILPVLQWAFGARKTINMNREMLETDDDLEGRDIIAPWMTSDGGPQGFATIPLEDDQGILGVLAIETDVDAPPLDDNTEELIGILANQTTVAIRNAELYQQIPMISMIEPIVSRARKAGANRRKFWVRAGVAAAVALAGFLIPFPTWVSGDATIRPATPMMLRAGTAGTVEEVLVIEGQAIGAGTVVARLRTDEIEMDLERTRAEAQRTRAEAAQARAQGDLATYRGRQAVLSQLLESEIFLEEELKRTELVAPKAGIVLTAHVRLRKGEHLTRGETFLELADLATLESEVAVSENKIHELAPGGSARLKVHAYPNRTFRGTVDRIAPRAGSGGSFRVTLTVDNSEGLLRPGMTGRAHLDAPNRPLLRTLLGPLFRGVRLKYWF